MYRTFHSKVGWWYWLLMGVTAFLLLDFFWFHHTVLMILTAVAMVFEIEMLIHTCYILTEDGRLRRAGISPPCRGLYGMGAKENECR